MFPWFLSSFSFNCAQSQIYKPFSATINLYNHQHSLYVVTEQ